MYVYIMFVVKFNGIFFIVFINHFPKIHRSVLCMTSVYGKKFQQKYAFCHAEQMTFYNFIILRKKRDSNTDVFLWNL